jgi:hypothetical protein
MLHSVTYACPPGAADFATYSRYADDDILTAVVKTYHEGFERSAQWNGTAAVFRPATAFMELVGSIGDPSRVRDTLGGISALMLSP